MILRTLLSLLVSLFLHAADDSWYSKIDAKVEAGMLIPSVSGTIKNSLSSADFKDDFGYVQMRNLSFFSLDLVLHYDYVPNIYVSYFNFKERENTTLTKSITIADANFSSKVTSSIDYQVLSALFYQDFKRKGKMLSFFGFSFYTGDIEFDVGLNAKIFTWNGEVNEVDTTTSPSWIHVNEVIPLPYIGAKYYLYNLVAYANASALSFSRAKSASFQAGLEYQVVEGLYLGVGYLYEQFKVQELEDTVSFVSEGYKVSFKYAF